MGKEFCPVCDYPCLETAKACSICGWDFSPLLAKATSRDHENRLLTARAAWREKIVRGQAWPFRGGEAQPLKALSPNGRFHASAREDGSIVVLREETNGRLWGRTLRGHEDTIRYLSFSQDSRILISADAGKTLYLWNVVGAQPRGETLRGHKDWVWEVSFSPDGHLFASASYDEATPLRAMTGNVRIDQRNLTREEWHTLMGEQPYRKIFEDLPVPRT
ncbi:MAG: hypothetical protein LBB76_00840 [Azoarcus sp.]|jgi:WD40 repeat protein|nr:hypothetical protein [Azoarcus sp.]